MESDSDDEKGRDDPGDGDDGTGTATTAKEPAYAPPRRMELTNLPGLHDRGGSMDDDGGRARPTHFITKLPNLVAINSAAYDASSHDMEREEGQYRGYVHNMIRWRYKTDGVGVVRRRPSLVTTTMIEQYHVTMRDVVYWNIHQGGGVVQICVFL